MLTLTKGNKNMKQVYVVFASYFYDSRILKTFSSEEKARKYLKEVINMDRDNTSYSIEVVEFVE
jgi:hypothetical protein